VFASSSAKSPGSCHSRSLDSVTPVGGVRSFPGHKRNFRSIFRHFTMFDLHQCVTIGTFLYPDLVPAKLSLDDITSSLEGEEKRAFLDFVVHNKYAYMSGFIHICLPPLHAFAGPK
jgi:hypothetical protein